MKNLDRALDDWKKIIGSENEIKTKSYLGKIASTTFKTTQKIQAVIKPKNKKEVQECLRVANKYKIPLYIISGGKNWGYGSAVPPTNNCVIMDLSRLNKIIDYNEKLAYVIVQPGVTFLQLHDYLRKKKSNLIVNNIGGSPDSSLIGNFVERGIGRGLYGNKYEHGCNLEIVLPTGELISTSNNNFSRQKIGPDVMGLFTQSNLGIVTKMTFWLAPKPSYFQTLFFYIEKNSELEKIIDVLRILKLETTVQGNLLIANEFRTLTNLQQYPWKESKGITPLPKKVLQDLKRKWNVLGAWNGKISLCASNKTELIAQRLRIKEAFKKIKIIFFFDEKEYVDLPGNQAIKSMYWRKKIPIPKKIDPDGDCCGVIWISPIVPFEGKNVLEVVNLMTKIMTEYHYEPNIGINCITDRKIYMTGVIIYDREVEGEDEKALVCYDKIYRNLIKKGYLPYRLSIQSMNNMPKPSKDYIYFIKKLKNTLDPNDILAPGRYDFRSYWDK